MWKARVWACFVDNLLGAVHLQCDRLVSIAFVSAKISIKISKACRIAENAFEKYRKGFMHIFAVISHRQNFYRYTDTEIFVLREKCLHIQKLLAVSINDH
jgi:hypothetical protein